MTLAVRNRNRTCPSFAASRNARTRRTGRTTSWIHRGIWIVGPGPAMRRIVRGVGRALVGDLATVRTWRPQRPARATVRVCAPTAGARRRGRGESPSAVVVAVLAIATLALTAFDGETSPAVSRPAPLPVTSAPPEPQILATVGNLRVQSPVAQGGVTAVGFHGSAEGALVLKPVGPQRNEGLLARLWHRITGASKTGLAWYQLSGGPLRTLDVGAVAGTDVYSPVDGTVVAIRDQIVSGKRRRRRDRAAAGLGAVARRVHPERAPGSGAVPWRDNVAARALEARNRDGHQPPRAAGAREVRRRGRQQRRPSRSTPRPLSASVTSPRSAHPLHRRRRGRARPRGARATPAARSSPSTRSTPAS